MRKNIEAERGRLQLTKGQLAKDLKITHKTYNKYINGSPIPSDVLECMARKFNCSVDYLLETR